VTYQTLKLQFQLDDDRLEALKEGWRRGACRSCRWARCGSRGGASRWRSRRVPPQVEPAEASYRQALALAEELGMRPLLAHSHLGLGTLYLTIGRLAQAHTELSPAVERYRAMEMVY
jgi:hypothetical protein